MERKTEYSIDFHKAEVARGLEALRKNLQGDPVSSDAIVNARGYVHYSIGVLKEYMVDVTDAEKELKTLEKELFEKGLLKETVGTAGTDASSEKRTFERHGERPTKEEIVKRAEEFVERMKRVDPGNDHNQIVKWSRGENFQEAKDYYPGWTREDLLLYAQEIKKRTTEEDWGVALYDI